MATDRSPAPARPRGSLARRAQIEQNVRQAAAQSFVAHGVANTSLADIADALGIGRTALYHYYANKDELLVALIAECAADGQAVLAAAASIDAPVSQRLREAVRRLAGFALERPERMRLLDTAAGLPLEAERIARSLNRQFFTDLANLVQQGVESGELRAVDPGVAAHTIVGSTRSVAWWFDPKGPRSAEFVADQLAETAVRGLLAEPSVNTAVLDAVASLRDGVDALARAVSDGSAYG